MHLIRLFRDIPLSFLPPCDAKSLCSPFAESNVGNLMNSSFISSFSSPIIFSPRCLILQEILVLVITLWSNEINDDGMKPFEDFDYEAVCF